MNEDLLTRLLTATDGPVGRLLLLHGARGAGKSCGSSMPGSAPDPAA